MGDGVKIGLFEKSKLEELHNLGTYTQIYSEKIENELLGGPNIYEKVLQLMILLSGARYSPVLSMSKFSKITPYFKHVGNNTIMKFDSEIAYKKIQTKHDQFDFYAFIDAIHYILNIAYGSDCELSSREKLVQFVDHLQI